MNRRVLQALLPVLVLALGVAAFAVLQATRPQTPSEPTPERVWTVSSRTVEPAIRHPEVRLHGYLESPRATTLSAEVAAPVAEVAVREGRQVEAGELLVQLDAAELNSDRREQAARVAEIDAQMRLEREQQRFDEEALRYERQLLELVERERRRAERLAERDVGSQSDLDNARQAAQQQALAVNQRRLAVADFEARMAALRARREQAAAALERAEQDVADSRITAPFAGRVARVEVAPGMRVQRGEAVAAIYDTAALEVRAHLPSPQLPAVRRALAAGEHLPATGRVDGTRLALRLDRLAGRSERGEAGAEALFRVRGRHSDLILGRFVRVSLRLPAVEGAVAVPFEALYGTDHVYKIVDGRMRRLEVERMGERRAEDGRRLALVRSAELGRGDRVVTSQLAQAADGLRVRAAERAGDSADAASASAGNDDS